MNLPSKVWSGKVVAGPNGCHIFTGSLNREGYGRVRKGGKLYRAHRFMYEECCGQIPEGKMICHRCNVKRCVNPFHLYAGTAADNMRDRKELGGYFFSEEHRAKLSSAWAGRKVSEETCDKQRAASLGSRHTDEARAKISAAKLGKKHSDQHRAKNRAAKLAKKASEETRAKMRAANLGKKRSEEARASMREAWVRRKNLNSTFNCN